MLYRFWKCAILLSYIHFLFDCDRSSINLNVNRVSGWTEGGCFACICQQTRSSKCNECCRDNWQAWSSFSPPTSLVFSLSLVSTSTCVISWMFTVDKDTKFVDFPVLVGQIGHGTGRIVPTDIKDFPPWVNLSFLNYGFNSCWCNMVGHFRYIQSTCATSGEGLYEGLDWLSNNIASKASIWTKLES